jgi:hypothetical protein
MVMLRLLFEAVFYKSSVLKHELSIMYKQKFSEECLILAFLKMF